MFDYSILFFSIVAYLIASILLLNGFRHTEPDTKPQPFNKATLISLIAIVLHVLYASKTSFVEQELNFSLSSMSVLVSATLVSIYMLTNFFMPIKRLGILVFPITIFCLMFSIIWHSPAYLFSTSTNQGLAFGAHIFVAIIAYCLLAISFIQALLYLYQEKIIKNHLQSNMSIAFPPLQTMEQLLFRLCSVGFILLSLTLLSGAIFSQQIFGTAFAFKHHTILAVIGWCVFALVLFKRFYSDLRGTRGAMWVISGFIVIQLGYFGTKIISESLKV